MSSSCSGHCSSCSSSCNAEEKLEKRLALIKHKILVLSGKGGVGKSTVAATLALTLARKDLIIGLFNVAGKLNVRNVRMTKLD